MRETGGLNSLRDRADELMGVADGRPEGGGSEAARPAGEGGRAGSVWDRVLESATIAPVQGDPSLEPVNEPWQVAMMAGWGDPEQEGRGHDAMQGMGGLLTGESDGDAMETMRLDGAGPLVVDDEDRMTVETGGRGPRLFGLRGTRLDAPRGSDEPRDWCSHL